MIQKIKTYVKDNKIFELGDQVVVGVSGGADSVALLYVLCELAHLLNLSLHVVHINHGIRKEADEDALYVKHLCEKLSIPFYLYEADIVSLAKAQKKTEEEMGRDYRYQCFDEVAMRVGAKKIAVAHHANDQAETVLFHMVRGTDLRGMAGMQPVSERENSCMIVRPMLCVEKAEIVAWLKEREIAWCEDVTNEDTTYARNGIRKVVMEELCQINDKAVSHIAKMAQTMSAYDEYISDQVDAYISDHVSWQEDGSASMNRDMVLDLPLVFANRVLYEIVCKVCGRKKDIEASHIDAIYDLLDKQSGKSVILPYQIKAITMYENVVIGKCLQVSDAEDRIYLEEFMLKPGATCKISIDEKSSLYLECLDYGAYDACQKEELLSMATNSKNIYTKFFDCAKMKDTLCVRSSMDSDYIYINEQRNRKSVSRYYIDQKVPSAMRKQKIVLAHENEVIWIIGMRTGAGYKIEPGTQLVLKATYEGE